MAPKTKSTNGKPSRTKSTDESKPKPAPPDARLWSSLNPPISPWLLEALECQGFNKMTPVQAGTIPLFLGNKDVVVEAVTGSGKTLAYLVPVVERLLKQESKKHYVMGIVVAPTRELASQIFTVLKSILEFHEPSSAFLSGDYETAYHENRVKPMLLLGGGQSAAADLKTFLSQSPNLLIGTPGRLNDLLASPYVHCTDSSFETLVLDEADKLLDLGFEEVLSKILARLPKQRRTGLFSATVTDAVVGSLVRAGLRNPVKIAVKVRTGAGEVIEEKRTPASLKMAYLPATHLQRLAYLKRLLTGDDAPQKSIVFWSTCAEADYFAGLLEKAKILPKNKVTLVSLHGKLAPNIRTKNFNAFSNATSPVVLFTTDLAARGLDIPQVDLVVQYDAPNDPKTFLHRAGRAGRAGRKGRAVLFLSPGKECEYVEFLAVRKTPVTLLQTEAAGPVDEEETKGFVKAMREVIVKDRAIYEKGMKAFVSYVRAYGKHQTSSIFRIQDLDWQDLALSFALIRQPSMPELKKLNLTIDLGLDAPIDTSVIPYASAHLEAQRLKNIANPPPPKPKDDKKKKRKQTEAWSDQRERKESREERRERKKARRERERVAKMGEEEKKKDEEWRALAEEVKEMRKKRKEKDVDGEKMEL